MSRRQRKRSAETNGFKSCPEAAAAYGALKRELAVRFAEDGDAYTKAKGVFIDQMVQAAMMEQA